SPCTPRSPSPPPRPPPLPASPGYGRACPSDRPRRSAPEPGASGKPPTPDRDAEHRQELHMPSASIHVHKFGGTSLADAARIRALGALLDDGAGSRLVVVSAMHGTTNALVDLAATARNGGDWLPAWEALRQRHLQAADALGSNGPHPGAAIAGDFDALHADAAMLATRPVD